LAKILQFTGWKNIFYRWGGEQEKKTKDKLAREKSTKGIEKEKKTDHK